jgi:hypothetical protein
MVKKGKKKKKNRGGEKREKVREDQREGKAKGGGWIRDNRRSAK